MAAISSLSFAASGLANDRKGLASSVRSLPLSFESFRIRISSVSDAISVRSSNASSRLVVRSMTTASDVPTVSETKLNFLKSYKRPIPSIYNTVLQELMVQQHLMRYKRTYKYDAVFALGFVTVYDQLMEGYPSNEDRDEIFRAYIQALKENPEKYRFAHCPILNHFESVRITDTCVEFWIKVIENTPVFESNIASAFDFASIFLQLRVNSPRNSSPHRLFCMNWC